MSFSVTKGFLKLNFRIGGRKPPGHNPLVQNPPVRRFWTRGLCSGVYVRQSWNLAFKSAMCDSVGFIYTVQLYSPRALSLNGDSDLGGLCPWVMSGHLPNQY